MDYRPQYIEDSFGVFLKDRYREAKGDLKKLFIFWIKTILRFPFTLKREYKFKVFRNKYFHLSDKHYVNKQEMREADFDYTHYFFGSDQIWNPELTEGLDSIFFGDFHKNAKKISYAASLGANSFSQDEMNRLIKYTNYLDVIGVREVSAKMLLEKNSDQPIYLNIDPTLLIEEDVWQRLADTSVFNGKYIFVYALEINEELIKIAKDLSERKGLKIIFCDLKNRYGKNGKSRYSTDPIEFLKLIKYADYVVTNSFHGTVFSVVYEKQFLSVPHKTRSTRVKDLLTMLEIPERVVYSHEDCVDIDETINYVNVKNKLEQLRKESINYIENILK